MALQKHAIEEIKEIVAQYQDEPTPLMMILSAVQSKFGYIPMEALFFSAMFLPRLMFYIKTSNAYLCI